MPSLIKKTDNIIKLIRQNEIANRFAKVFSVDVFVKGANFLLLPVYLHLMSQNEVGTFNYLYTFIQTMSIVLNFGLYSSQSKLYHDYSGIERGRLLFSLNMVLIILLCIVLFPIYALQFDVKLITFLFEYPIPYQTYRWPLLLALLASVGSYMLFNFLLTSENIRKVQLYNLLRMFISNGVVIVILYFSEEDKVLMRIVTYYTCEIFLWAFFSIGYVKQFITAFDVKYIKRIFSFSFPVFLLSLLSTIQGFSDKFFVQQKTDMAVMAVYTTGITIASVCSLIIMSFQNIWLPIFFKEKNVEVNFRKTKKMVKIIALLFVCIAILMTVGVIIALNFNIIPTTYSRVTEILPFLFLAQIIAAINAMYGNYFLYFERTKLGAVTGGCAYLICFILNFVLIPRFGVTGAIIALLLGNAVVLTTVYCVVMKLYRKNRLSKHESIDYSVVVPK